MKAMTPACGTAAMVAEGKAEKYHAAVPVVRSVSAMHRYPSARLRIPTRIRQVGVQCRYLV